MANDRFSPNVPQNWGSVGSVPMIYIAPPPQEPSSTRGAAGVFILLVTLICAVVGFAFSYLNWVGLDNSGGLAASLRYEKAITARTSVDETTRYGEDLERQNALFCRNQARPLSPQPEVVATKSQQEEINTARSTYRRLCSARRLRDGLRCEWHQPPLPVEDPNDPQPSGLRDGESSSTPVVTRVCARYAGIR